MELNNFISKELEEDFTHAFSLKTGRYICSDNHPKPKNAPNGSRWEHRQAQETEDDFDDIRVMKCPVCGETWKEELPQ